MHAARATADEPAAAAPTRWRWVWPVLAGAIAGASVVLLGTWIEEPLQRKAILFEAPVRLEAGATVTGRFTPQRTGPYEICVRIPREEPLAPLSDLIGAGWCGREGPPGIVASYAVREVGGEERRGRSGDLGSGSLGAKFLEARLGFVEAGRDLPTDLALRIEQAKPQLASRQASIVVGPTGDWISYAWLESWTRRALVFLTGGFLIVVAAVVFFVRRGRRSRRSPSDPATVQP